MFDKVLYFDDELEDTAFCLYMPVFHRGHQELFDKYPEVTKLLLMRPDDLEKVAPVKKDLHALDMETMGKLMEGLDRFEYINDMGDGSIYAYRNWKLITADDEVEKWLEKMNSDQKIQHEEVFLKMDEKENPGDTATTT